MKKYMLLGALALTLGAAGCDDNEFGDDPIFALDAADLVGFWTGQAQIFGSQAELATLGSGAGGAQGFQFPVALTLRADQSFELRTFGYPASSGGLLGNDRVCTGVWEDEGWTLEFFPNAECKALPLYRYTVGHVAPSGITLTAEMGGAGVDAPAVIRVRMRLDRD